jgi:hypothetical protein
LEYECGVGSYHCALSQARAQRQRQPSRRAEPQIGSDRTRWGKYFMFSPAGGQVLSCGLSTTTDNGSLLFAVPSLLRFSARIDR